MSFCEIILLGRLGSDPELRFTETGHAVCNFSFAVNSKRKQGDEWVDSTTWFRVSCWGSLAEHANQYLQKGSQALIVSNQISVNAYTNQQGEARASLEVTAREVKFLGGKGDTNEETEQPF